jgi:hypothetical protein
MIKAAIMNGFIFHFRVSSQPQSFNACSDDAVSG